MKAFLTKIDIFGVPFTFLTFGKSKFTTWFGGLMTLICISIIGVFSVFFSDELIYKKNPNIYEQTKINKVTKMFPLSNENFQILFRLADNFGNEVPIETSPLHFFTNLFHYRKDDEGVFQIVHQFKQMHKKCSETTTVNNKELIDFNLKNWWCIDWKMANEEAKEKLWAKEPGYEASIGGGLDEKQVSVLQIQVNSSYFNTKTNTWEKKATAKQITDMPNYLLNIIWPNAIFQADSLE